MKYDPIVVGVGTSALASSSVFADLFDNVEAHQEPHWVNYPNKPAKRFSSKSKPSRWYRKMKNKQQKQSRKRNR